MSQKNKVCMELVFTRTSSDSQTAKIREFWKFIDSQDEIQPYKVEEYLENRKSLEKKNSISVCESKSGKNFDKSERTSNCTCEKEEKEKQFWYKELQLFKALGLDKIALSTCKRRDFEASRKENENLILSDMVDQTYEEVKSDLENFEKRLKNKKSK